MISNIVQYEVGGKILSMRGMITMLQAYKNRVLEDDSEVEVYRNLNNQLFSIRCSKSGLVIAHGDDFILLGSTPKVSEAGRQRALKERSKNVHAYVSGQVAIDADMSEYEIFDELYYNPYEQDKFTLKLHKCDFAGGDVLMKSGKAYALVTK